MSLQVLTKSEKMQVLTTSEKMAGLLNLLSSNPFSHSIDLNSQIRPHHGLPNSNEDHVQRLKRPKIELG